MIEELRNFVRHPRVELIRDNQDYKHYIIANTSSILPVLLSPFALLNLYVKIHPYKPSYERIRLSTECSGNVAWVFYSFWVALGCKGVTPISGICDAGRDLTMGSSQFTRKIAKASPLQQAAHHRP